MAKVDLFTPIKIGSLQLPNRVVMAPMTRNRAGEGNAPTALNAEYYVQRAGAGLIVTEATQVSPQGVGYPRTPGIHTDIGNRGRPTPTTSQTRSRCSHPLSPPAQLPRLLHTTRPIRGRFEARRRQVVCRMAQVVRGAAPSCVPKAGCEARGAAQASAMRLPVSSTLLRSLSTQGWPPPPMFGSSWEPLTIVASIGMPSSSWVTVSEQTPPSYSLMS